MTGETVMGKPVCLIHGGHEGLRVAEEGVRLLEALNEPIAVVCLAGQYRTGKSFFLNQLTRTKQRLEHIHGLANGDDGAADAAPSELNGFRVGPTTESCTRGIWLWDPQPSIRNARGEKVLFMDTEGIAATDNDESYDAKIFSLGLLLSSLFVFNTMGVIDEAAIDRLFLVSELTKHVCVSANPDGKPTNTPKAKSLKLDESDDIEDDTSDPLAESRELAPHFPPFIWLLRDFMLDMQADGTSLTPNEYLEKSLELRDGSSRRNEDRNRIRTSIRVLFARRECLTLVRPVMDEMQLRHAAELEEKDLRPEFVQQMQAIREHVLKVVAPKQLFGKVMDGRKLAHLVRCYTDTLNSGSIPDIKAAWEYVSEATCQMALMNAVEKYDDMIAVTNQEAAEGEAVTIINQQEFEKIHKDAQDESLNIFKTQSVEGPSRTACFQKLKAHIQKHKTANIALLQKRSTTFCEQVVTELRAKYLQEPREAGRWDAIFLDATIRTSEDALNAGFAKLMDTIEAVYEEKAQGPSKKVVFYNFLRHDVVSFYQSLFDRLAKRFDTEKSTWEQSIAQLEQAKAAMEARLEQRLHEKQMEIKMLEEVKAHLEEKERMQLQKIEGLQEDLEKRDQSIAGLEEKKKALKASLDELQSQHDATTKELDAAKLHLEHREESLNNKEIELKELKQFTAQERESMRATHQEEKETWIKKLADQTAEKSTLQKAIKQKENELAQRGLEMELLRKGHEQLVQQYEDEVAVRKQKEKECLRLRDLNVNVEKRLEESFARQMMMEDDVEKEKELLLSRLERYQTQLGRIEADKEVEQVLQECVGEVIRLAEVDKIRTLTEERQVLQERLGELYLKISTLPDFYQRQIFCSPDPEPNFFDALTS